MLLPVRIFWCHCLQKVNVYQQTKFRPYISIGGWDIAISGFEIQSSAILEFYFRCRSRPVHCNLHVILHQATEFRPNLVHPLWKYDVISIYQDDGCEREILLPVSYLLMSLPSERQSLSANQILSWYLNWRLRTISVFEIQTSAMMEFYFRFRSRPFSHNLQVIVHQAAKFRPNRNIRHWNMTSYPFLKMAAATAIYYFRFRICQYHCLQKVKVY